ncbi:hypothetical protein K9M41_03880 [Candidatus Gracilibacteria bacterium]|nr:hypothetical protein [Candidatus Gracilibacteria bacterium]
MVKLFIRFLFWTLLIVGSRLAFAGMASPHGINEVNPNTSLEEMFQRQGSRIIKPSYRRTRGIHQAQIESVMGQD